MKIILWVLGIRNPEFEALADKRFVHNLQHPNSEFSTTTGAVRNGKRLYICSLATDAVGVLKLP